MAADAVFQQNGGMFSYKLPFLQVLLNLSAIFRCLSFQIPWNNLFEMTIVRCLSFQIPWNNLFEMTIRSLQPLTELPRSVSGSQAESQVLDFAGEVGG